MDENATCEREMNRFQLGQVVAVPGALAAIEALGQLRAPPPIELLRESL
jgi:hypothetical protein